MGVYASILLGLIKAANYIAAALQERHDELNGVFQQTAADKTEALKNAEIAQIIRDKNAGLSHDALVARLRADGQG